MMNLSEVMAEFAARRTDASDTDSDTTGNRYVRELAGRLDDDGTILWESRAKVKPWAMWLRQERDKTVWEATRADVRAHLRAMQRADYAPKTMILRLSAISTFYQEIEKMNKLPEHDLPGSPPGNPAEDIDKSDFKMSGKKTKRGDGLKESGNIHAPTPLEVDKMCDNVPGTGPQALRDELLIRLMAWCGLRRGEVAKLKVEDVDQDGHEIWVPPVKSDDGRPVPYPETLNTWLDPWLHNGYRDAVARSYAGESDFLFPTQESEHLHGYSINRVVKQSAENAGIQEDIGEYAESDDEERKKGTINKIIAHSLRHHYGVQAVKSGIPITYLRDLMGHHSVDISEVYLDLAEDDTVEVGRRFDPNAEAE